MENLIETINGVNYIQLEQYVRVCEELKDVNYDYKVLEDKYKKLAFDDDGEKCEVLKNTCNALREENDELKSQNHDYGVMIVTLLYLLGVRE